MYNAIQLPLADSVQALVLSLDAVQAATAVVCLRPSVGQHMCVPNRCVLQDAEGCRLSHVAGAWLFEAAGLPAVRGDSYGVTLEPCPGAARLWIFGTHMHV